MDSSYAVLMRHLGDNADAGVRPEKERSTMVLKCRARSVQINVNSIHRITDWD
jgi:hypothetical protein